MENQERTPHIVAFDILNVLACVSVVALHVNDTVWVFSRDNIWLTSMIVQVACYWAVPVFIMLSGATLMDYRERYDTRTFFMKRFKKTVVPFFAWSFFAVAWAILHHDFPYKQVVGPRSLWNYIVTAGVEPIYWFFSLIWGLYLCIPALSLVPKERRMECFGYTAVVGFITVSFMPKLASCLNVEWPLAFPLDGGGCVIYLLLGYMVTRARPTKRQLRLVYVMGVASALLMYVGEVYLSYQVGAVVKFWRGYANFPSVLLALAVFSAVYYHDWSHLSCRVVALLKELSSLTFGVYLVHIYFIHAASDLSIDTRSWAWRTAGILVVYALSLGVTRLLKRVPVLKEFVP